MQRPFLQRHRADISFLFRLCSSQHEYCGMGQQCNANQLDCKFQKKSIKFDVFAVHDFK